MMEKNPLVIFCDFQNTLDLKDSPALLDKLQEMKDNGVTIYMATNASKEEALLYEKNLVDQGYNFFSELIYLHRLIRYKDMPTYWEKALKEFRLNPKDVVLIDDDQKNVQNALQCGVKAIQHINAENTVRELNTLYKRDISPGG